MVKTAFGLVLLLSMAACGPTKYDAREVKEGDTLTKITHEMTGNGSYWGRKEIRAMKVDPESKRVLGEVRNKNHLEPGWQVYVDHRLVKAKRIREIIWHLFVWVLCPLILITALLIWAGIALCRGMEMRNFCRSFQTQFEKHLHPQTHRVKWRYEFHPFLGWFEIYITPTLGRYPNLAEKRRDFLENIRQIEEALNSRFRSETPYLQDEWINVTFKTSLWRR